MYHFGRIAVARNLLWFLRMIGINALLIVAAVASTDPVPDAVPESETPTERWKKFSDSEHHVAGSIIGASVATIAVLVPTLAVMMVVGIPESFERSWGGFCWGDTSGNGSGHCSSSSQPPPVMSNAATYGLILFAVGSITFVPYGAFLGHSLGKGKGDGKSAFWGSVIGTAVTVALVVASSVISHDSDGTASDTAAATLLALASVAPMTGAVIGLERSHASQAIPHVGFAPTNGGGRLSLAWKF